MAEDLDQSEETSTEKSEGEVVEKRTQILNAESPRAEVSAATIGRMLGLATSMELKLLEGKLELALTKINTFGARLDRIMNTLNKAPTGSDLERIDVQIGALRSMIRDALTDIISDEAKERMAKSDAEVDGKGDVDG